MENKNSSEKAQIYNLMIVDESGSMSGLENITMQGINETLRTIREAQKQFADKQEHFVTLVTFDSRGNYPPVRTLIDAKPIGLVADFKNYTPYGGTPLYDAMGQSLTRLHEKIRNNENATAVVTVLTDGYENSSEEWTAQALRQLIDQLKEEGWTFSYMGSAHDVKQVTIQLSIDNVVEFQHDSMGAENTWARERSSKQAYFARMSQEFDPQENWEQKKARKMRMAQEYYSNRVTPERIRTLEPNQVFVFGSNPEGQHLGGTAQYAERHFGAEMGRGEGIQGQSYAIPTTAGLPLLEEAISRFCTYAAEHPQNKFLVTPIGCGHAGFTPRQVAPLFKSAIELENVALPLDFWDVLGLKMN